MRFSQYIVGSSLLFAAINLYAATPTAQVLLKQALAAQGGEDKLRAIKSVAWEASAYLNGLEQSERPEGPYIVTWQKIQELHDPVRQRLVRDVASHFPPDDMLQEKQVLADGVLQVSNGQAPRPGSTQQLSIAQWRLGLSPERLLLTAQEATDLHQEKDQLVLGVKHQVLGFSFQGTPVHVFLNPYSHLPRSVEYRGPLARAGFSGFLVTNKLCLRIF